MKPEQYRVTSCELRVNVAGNNSRLAPRASQLGMTLIELMVVIVILVTLVAGVLPLVSPNNDARKIAESSRMLQTYFTQAQAEAARIGRPVGIGFSESSVGSGVALEAFQILVPPRYSGLDDNSRISRVPAFGSNAAGGLQMEIPEDDAGVGLTYGKRDSNYNPYGNRQERFPEYYGAKLYGLHTQRAIRDTNGNIQSEELPPGMFQIGDIIEIEGNRFVIVDDPRNLGELLGKNRGYLNPSANDGRYKDTFVCIRLEDVLEGTKAPPLAVPPTGYKYAIHRQPMGNERVAASPEEKRIVSGESPLQFPAGVAIDMMASGFEANEMALIYDQPRYLVETSASSTVEMPYNTGVLFSPNGGIDSVWINGQRYLDVSRVFFLVGRVENGNPDDALFTNWESGTGGTNERMSDNEFRDRISKLNWMNPDSRWLTVNANDGRLSVSQNANVDPRDHAELKPAKGSLTDDEFALLNLELQIEAAHELAHGGHGDEQP